MAQEEWARSEARRKVLAEQAKAEKKKRKKKKQGHELDTVVPLPKPRPRKKRKVAPSKAKATAYHANGTDNDDSGASDGLGRMDSDVEDIVAAANDREEDADLRTYISLRKADDVATLDLASAFALLCKRTLSAHDVEKGSHHLRQYLRWHSKVLFFNLALARSLYLYSSGTWQCSLEPEPPYRLARGSRTGQGFRPPLSDLGVRR